MKKTNLLKTHKELLKTCFLINPFPSADDRLFLANYLNINERSIQIWFQNERQKRDKKYNGSMYYKNVYTGSLNVLVDLLEIISKNKYRDE